MRKASYRTCNRNIFEHIYHDYQCILNFHLEIGVSFISYPFAIRKLQKYRQVMFCARVMFLKNIAQIRQKIYIKKVYFMGVRGLTT